MTKNMNKFGNVKVNEKKRKSSDKFEISESVQRLMVKDVINETVEIEPSFYQKDEISDDVKSVMRHVDNMLVEASKPLQRVII